MFVKLKPLDIVSAALFAALMGIGANITAYLVIGGVPITLQPIIAMIAGALLGSRLGALSMIIYMLIGLVGIPVFAEFSGGFRALVSPTFGFILSFILTAFVTGKIIERKQNPSMAVFFIAAFTGLVINYLLGTNYMYYAYLWIAEAPDGFSYSMVWAWMILPLIKDIIFTALAAASVPKLQRLLNKRLKPFQRTA
ncbi:biotin transport system substrate-specific component [Alteribacillus bidgolensis]|uniref:Biotin transporter n=2 Tax=Alteribacillus bidgolensis TaxID=930129 RepID=A0A1G8EKP3_9BACI|nr:biotin transporter BioY [Alteribacillus bidgolensis]SDH70420.1 biotin transport system substrate-specific component [Alteribacillus bidgolensis]